MQLLNVYVLQLYLFFYIDGVFLMYWRLSLRVSKNRDE